MPVHRPVASPTASSRVAPLMWSRSMWATASSRGRCAPTTRVTVMERVNVRDLRPDVLPFVPDLIVADLSFISLRTVLPVLASISAPEASYVLLVKPQFEAGPADVGSGGVVRSPAVWRRVLEEIVAASEGALIHARRRSWPRRCEARPATLNSCCTAGSRMVLHGSHRRTWMKPIADGERVAG